jgi:membrane-bound serine protease (ClpP class)
LISSSYALQVLPVDGLGIALVLLAFVLFVVDLTVTNHGLPAVGGIVALILGCLMLFDATSPYSWASLIILVTVAILAGTLFVGVLGEALVAKGRPVTTGTEGMIGEVGEVREPVGAGSPGWVLVHGERWRAVAGIGPGNTHGQDHEQAIGVGRRVQVVGFMDGKVVVLPFEPALPGRSPENLSPDI